MNKPVIILCAILSVALPHSALGAFVVDNLVTNGTFDGDGTPWVFKGRDDTVGVIPEELVIQYGDSFAFLSNSGRGLLGGGYAIQKVLIPDSAETLYLDFDYGFYEQGDDDASDDRSHFGLPGDTAFLGVGLLGVASGVSIVVTESTFEFLPPTYEDIFTEHFSRTFNVRHAAGGTAFLFLKTVSLNESIVAVSAIDNVSLTTSTPVPLPSSLLLLAGCLIGLAAIRHKRSKA